MSGSSFPRREFLKSAAGLASAALLPRWGGSLHAADANNLPPVRLGNKAIALKLCRNVLIRDVTIFHGGHFAILVTGCDNLTVDNVTMDTDRDGIDIDCCRNTMVSNCRINSPNDDGLCPKRDDRACAFRNRACYGCVLAQLPQRDLGGPFS